MLWITLWILQAEPVHNSRKDDLHRGGARGVIQCPIELQRVILRNGKTPVSILPALHDTGCGFDLKYRHGITAGPARRSHAYV